MSASEAVGPAGAAAVLLGVAVAVAAGVAEGVGVPAPESVAEPAVEGVTAEGVTGVTEPAATAAPAAPPCSSRVVAPATSITPAVAQAIAVRGVIRRWGRSCGGAVPLLHMPSHARHPSSDPTGRKMGASWEHERSSPSTSPLD
ncbi:hypothetical protein [Streptacidiphilus sp. PAMC 29251]